MSIEITEFGCCTTKIVVACPPGLTDEACERIRDYIADFFDTRKDVEIWDSWTEHGTERILIGHTTEFRESDPADWFTRRDYLSLDGIPFCVLGNN